MVKIAHLSDIHFHTKSLNPFQIFSKRLLGNANWMLNRKGMEPNLYKTLIDQLSELETDYVVISGDFTTTSHPKEFALAKQAISEFEAQGMKVFAIPGNHDTYTRRAEREGSFYKHLDLPDDKLSAHKLDDGLWLVTLDTTRYISYISSGGHFTKELEKHLDTLLDRLEGKVILVNHFPFFQHEHPLKRLIFGENLQALLRKHPKVLLYLHGHTHRHTFADLRADGLPIIADSGSLADRKKSTWNLFDLSENRLDVHTFRLGDNPPWNLEQTHTLQI